MSALDKRAAGPVLASILCAAAVLCSPAAADVVHPDDVIVQGSLCVGFDCADGEPFGFDTEILKENNLRVFFDDTSVSSFPANDWRLVANDSASGGANFFALEDATALRQVFRVDAGAPLNALYVASTGNVGAGTATPVLKFHAHRGDTPGIRFEQDASGGFTPQTWDVAGNEANFFVRDVTGGSKLPFRIRPGAPTSSIDVAATGRVGLGTTNPGATLHVAAQSGTVGVAGAAVLLTNESSAVSIDMVPQSTTNTQPWILRAVSTDAFNVFRRGSPVTAFRLAANGNLRLAGTITTTGTTCGGGCDRVFDADYDLPTISEHAALMWDKGHLPNVGPTPENAAIDLSDKLGRMLNELETAHIYIDQLQQRIERLEAQLAQK